VGLAAETRPNDRRERYVTRAAERFCLANGSRYSLLPYQELARLAGLWYDACAEATLRGNYAPLADWVRNQAQAAADQGFELADLLQFLRVCRQVAIEKEGWNEDLFAELDAIIDEAFANLRHLLPWNIPEGLNYLTGKGRVDHAWEEYAASIIKPRRDRRAYCRNKLRFPIRVRGRLRTGSVDEFVYTENVARGGLYFLSNRPYFKGAKVGVIYPYWDTYGAINREYPAEVVRIDDHSTAKGVAIKFLVNLGPPR